MQIKMTDKTTAVIERIEHFDLTHTFMCGQCFRWYENGDKTYTGIAYGRAVRFAFENGTLTIFNTTEEDVRNIWIDYLDLERDYSQIKSMYSTDRYVAKAMEFGYGIHILNQDIFECLISFIISTQNQIPRIKKIVASLSEMYGKACKIGDETLHAFPTAEELKDVKTEDLLPLKVGYRADYITDAVSKVLSGEVNLAKINDMTYQEAKTELMKIRGVGPKVADCVLLFSGRKSEAFPVDVWVQRTMRTLYLDEKATNKQIEAKAAQIFGKYAGFAQQYLFYYSRENGNVW